MVILGGATTTAILQWAAMARSYGTTREAAARIEVLLTATPPVAGYGERPGPGPERGSVVASDVSFRWRSIDPAASAHLVLDAVAVRLRPGEHVALAGRSGSGKSTFAQLLARFMDPVSGAIAVAEHPLPEYERDGLARAVSLLPQDVSLFQETVRENLLLATDEPLDHDALWAALRIAHADDIVERLPEGLDTVLSENGRSLSGGERQRLALARAVIHPAAVLILDEAASQLDVLSERDVQDAVTGARGRRTTITIAHRLSTLLGAERILVLDEGRLVGDGVHSELLESCPAYRSLVLPQLEAAQ
ncbi:ABC transporter ATP-binding protein [Microbacterium sp.]|uniref:ABC transporter ATP-binding protein n=1 Tax=Microbacterium sp. TaxID=51671 RepID=UPI003C74B4EE